ncbi:G-type lectin S-receptor-like serine/threonine-protein kinase At4g03230 [Magnolia sinica]|uniref:G-type lectin S-receptor-like serine/threonine-protein kinase At4g03230 n=1 Tax=Magnolia sinica TaxID=86752 RepID=UPI00265B0380|nr:G-type lectin S-receptor-like serine/threonine-protein kinase At4g03230 [Magnolia sinica]
MHGFLQCNNSTFRLMEKSSISLVFPSFFILFLFCFLSLTTADSIRQFQSIKDGETINSDGEIFELGFFSPNNSKNRYVGIWYHNIPVKTVIWVANRETPLTDSSGVLTIGSNGNLVILNGKNNTIWSTNASILSDSTVATLFDSGNLILRDANSNNSNTILWQSFEDPSNTLLPGMKIGVNLVTRQNRFLRSWKTDTDPTPGIFSFGINLQDSNQFFVWQGSSPHWRTGYWNDRSFNQIPVTSNSFIFHFTTVSNEESIYLEYSALYNNTRMVMDVSGRVECRIWYDSTKTWGVAWMQPKDECGVYGVCGKNTRCSDSNTPPCECLRGFEPVSSKEWNSGNWSSGCKRRTALKCGEEDEFLSLGRLKVPDHEFLVAAAGKAEDCRAECVRNCSCNAYVFTNVSGGASQCLVWFGNLMDIGDLIENQGAQDIHIRIAASELSTKKNRRLKVIVATTVVAGVLLLGAFFYCFRRMAWKKAKHRRMSTWVPSDSSAQSASDLLDTDMFVKDGLKGVDIPFFEFNTIVVATDNFSQLNYLGEGGFGSVYKGKLPGGQEMAVKRLSRTSGQGLEEFKTELVLIAKLQHRNLVRLLGYSIKQEEKMLLYEYLPNKSLDSFLFDKDRCKILDWEKRFNIILGIARGLLYLHQDSRLRIIHRDLKTSNILLDEEMNPKISDFGMARIFGGNQTQANTNRVVGTYGYMSPEYASHGLFSVKSDVFSFGVILLEIISGMKNNSFFHSDESSSLPEHAWGLWKENNGLALMDPSLRETCNTSEVLKCIHVGLLCVQENVTDRPTMASVVATFVSETASLPTPKQAAFIMRRDLSEVQCSKNEITFTGVEGR